MFISGLLVLENDFYKLYDDDKMLKSISIKEYSSEPSLVLFSLKGENPVSKVITYSLISELGEIISNKIDSANDTVLQFHIIEENDINNKD